MREKPKVSIIIPVYNAEETVERAVLSALNQDYPNFEVLVLDNESKDNSYDVVESMERSSEAFLCNVPNYHKYSWHEPTRHGLEIMDPDSQYFMFLAADDYLEPNFISNNMMFFAAAPNRILALQSPIKNVGEYDGPITAGYHYRNLKEFKKMCLAQCPVKTPTVVWNKSVFQEGLMKTDPEKYAGADDYWMYCNQADNGLFIWPAPKWLGYNYYWSKAQATWGMHKDYGDTIDKMIQKEWSEKWKL